MIYAGGYARSNSRLCSSSSELRSNKYTRRTPGSSRPKSWRSSAMISGSTCLHNTVATSDGPSNSPTRGNLCFPHSPAGQEQWRGGSLQRQLYHRGQRAHGVQPLHDHKPQHYLVRIHAAPDALARLLLEIVAHAYPSWQRYELESTTLASVAYLPP
jgi:hypothetical protein